MVISEPGAAAKRRGLSVEATSSREGRVHLVANTGARSFLGAVSELLDAVPELLDAAFELPGVAFELPGAAFELLLGFS